MEIFLFYKVKNLNKNLLYKLIIKYLEDGSMVGKKISKLIVCSSLVLTCLGLTGYSNSSSAKEKDRKSTRLNSSHANISYAVFCLKKNISVSLDFLLLRS